jgi:hypothetical protein
MNNDFSKLKNYVNEKSNQSSSIGNTFSNAKASVFSFFNNDSTKMGSVNSLNSDDQNDSWFKEADSDPYCPKLV